MAVVGGAEEASEMRIEGRVRLFYQLASVCQVCHLVSPGLCVCVVLCALLSIHKRCTRPAIGANLQAKVNLVSQLALWPCWLCWLLGGPVCEH